MRGEAAAHVQAHGAHARLVADVLGDADIAFPCNGIGALRARVEGQRGHITAPRHLGQQLGRQFRRCAELRPEIIGRAQHRQLEPGRYLDPLAVDLCRHLREQLVQFGPAVHRPGRDAHLDRMGDLGSGAHGVVVMTRGIGGHAADQVDLEGGCDVETLEACGDEVLDHDLIGVRLDRIGHKPRKTVDELPRPVLQDRRCKDHDRMFRSEMANDIRRIVPDGLLLSHCGSFRTGRLLQISDSKP